MAQAFFHGVICRMSDPKNTDQATPVQDAFTHHVTGPSSEHFTVPDCLTWLFYHLT